MKLEYLTRSPFQTRKLGEALAKEVLKAGEGDKSRVLGLIGDLGGGKTTFLQGFAKGLGIKERVLSPTFVILKKFKIKKKAPFDFFYHIDCYRIGGAKDLAELGFREIAADPANIVAAEWADKTKNLLPKGSIFLKFEFIDKDTRKIKVSAH
ncbi:MAG: tRNA (adenosine(37)-N6)-threonylcarbamoyltransferase complex ATPase subunit type 1 TsaE [Candidatus Paceibacterota bacterium]|jgi:tRNA threonylcarbamoyladenosine biosynthesis protein TsaE